MASQHPEIITRYWYSIDWSVRDLWAMDLPQTTMPIDTLIWHLDVPVWPDAKGRPYRVSPRDVVTQRAENEAEFARVMAADLSYPIDVIDRGGRYMILDGIHRLTKHWLAGGREMRVRVAPQDAVDWID